MSERNLLRDAVRFALTAGISASVVAPIAVSAQSNDVAEQDKVTVTGSRIKRVDIEGPQAVTVISRDDIDASGDISVAEVLRGTTFNTFGSFKQSSGSSAQSQSTVSLRGLGASRTLVLLDGKRMAGSPTFGAGSAQNLNVIPIAAVERIEILRDGASAVYGSDAVGGVINVILRKDYEGVNLMASIGRPTADGGDEEQYGITGGISSGKGNITFALDHSAQEIIFNGDRDFSDVGLSSFGFPGSFFAGGTDSFGNFVSLGTFPDPRCPSGVTDPGTGAQEPDTSDPLFPASVVVAPRCRYNYAGVSANEASIERDTLFLKGNYEVSDNVNFFARGIFTRTDSFGRYAPTPQVGGSPFLPTMSADNPNNPTNPANATNAVGDDLSGVQSFVVTVPVFDGAGDPVGDGGCDLSEDADGNPVDPDCSQATQVETVTGPFDLSIFYRNVPGGFRDSLVQGTLVDVLAGFDGSLDWFGGSEWELSAAFSQQENKDTSKGLAIRSALQNALDDGSFDVFSVNTDATSPEQAAVAQTFVHEGFHDEETRIITMDGTIGFDLAQMASGPVGFAIGFEYRDEKFSQNYDALQNAGNVDGSAGGQDIGGARTVFALFSEIAIPIMDNLNFNIKGRFDSYNDFGTTFNPQFSLDWRPVDSLLLRASYGEGFRAPSMSQLYSGLAQSFNGAIDTFGCANQVNDGNAANGEVVDNGDGTATINNPTEDLNGDGVADANDFGIGSACIRTQYQNLSGGNPGLDAEESENFGAGFVWSPLDDLTVAVDYYDIELTQEIGTVPLQDILDAEFLSGGSALVTRNSNGGINLISANNQNLEGRRTDGIDVEVDYAFGLGDAGDFGINVLYTHIFEYEQQILPSDPFRRLQSTFDVDTRANLGLSWSRGDFAAALNGSYITDTAFSDESAMLSSWTTWDLQVAWTTPWDGKVSVGARNLFDEDPPTDFLGLDNPFYANSLHDIYGRVPYLRYEQEL